MKKGKLIIKIGMALGLLLCILVSYQGNSIAQNVAIAQKAQSSQKVTTSSNAQSSQKVTTSSNAQTSQKVTTTQNAVPPQKATTSQSTVKPVLFPQQWGFIDQTGKIVIGRKYERVGDFHSGLAVARLNGKDGFIDQQGNVVIPFQFTWAEGFSEGLAAVNVGGQVDPKNPAERPSGGLWGYIDNSGQMVIAPQFAEAGNFSGGYAIVQLSAEIKKYVYIDMAGKIAFPRQFDTCYNFTGEFTLGNNGGQGALLNKQGVVAPNNGNPVQGQAESGFQDGLAVFRPVEYQNFLSEQVGFVDANLSCVIQPQFSQARPFVEGMAAVSDGLDYGKWSFINTKGKLAFSYKYDAVGDFSSGLARVMLKGLYHEWYGFIEKTGRLVLPFEFREAHPFSEGLAYVLAKDGKRGFVDKTGKLVVSLPLGMYGAVNDFSEGLAAVSTWPGYGLVDEKGKVVVPAKYSRVGKFAQNGLARVEFNGFYGYIDRAGKEVIPAELESTVDFKNGLLAGYKWDGLDGFVVYNEKGVRVKSIETYTNARYPKSLLKPGKKYVLSIEGLNLRKNPATNAERVTVIPCKAEVQVLEKTDIALTMSGIKGHWVKVKYKNATGYVFDGFLTSIPLSITYKEWFGDYLLTLMGKVSEEKYLVDNYTPLSIRVGETGIINYGRWMTDYDCVNDICIPGITLEEAFLMVKLLRAGDEVCAVNDIKLDRNVPIEKFNFPVGDWTKITLGLKNPGADIDITLYKAPNGYVGIREVGSVQ